MSFQYFLDKISCCLSAKCSWFVPGVPGDMGRVTNTVEDKESRMHGIAEAH